jgi:hypothetical protein
MPADQSFPLRTSCLGASGQGVRLGDSGVAWRTREGEQRRGLGAIVSVDVDWQTGGDDPDARCDFAFADGLAMTVHLDHDKPAEIAAYCQFLIALQDRLGAEACRSILLRHGSRPAKRMWTIIATGSLLALSIGVFLFGLFSRETYEQPNEWLLPPLMLLFVVALAFGLRAAILGGQKPFERSELLKVGLAPAWRKANGIVD